MPQNMGSCKYFFNFKDVIRLKGFWKGSVFTIAISLYNLSALAESESDVEDVITRKRPQRKFKNIPLNLRSPFWNEHGMKIKNATVPDKLLSNYAFVQVLSEHPKDELLFNFGDIEITRDHFISLSVGQVENIFLDVWALRLSMLDKERAPGQPKRVFFSTIAYLQLDPTHEWMKRLPMEKMKQNFYERMTYEIERLQNLDINDADLIFFPVLRHGHYFLICINVKASKLEIIDNKSLVSGVTMKDKYGDCTTLLL